MIRSARSSSQLVATYDSALCAASYLPERLPQRTQRRIAIHFWSYRWFTHQREGMMSLKKEYVRDGNRRIIGSVTSGYSDTSSVVRDEHEIAGRTSERFRTTRDAHGKLVSTNSADPGFLIRRK